MPELLVRRDDLASCQLVEGEPRREDLGEGEAQLVVERFALTTNNITYAVFGDALGYWKLLPAPEGWGRIPAWGYARVAASRAPELPEGGRFFGVVPMGSHLTVRPAPGPAGFLDASPHRAGLSPVYNQYLPVQGDGDDIDLIMRPLFGTSVLLDLSLSEQQHHGAETVVLTSASSKTAYGLAHLLSGRPVRTVGLTSASRRDWVTDLGLYDEVLAYDDLSSLDGEGAAVLVDFTGDPSLLEAVRERLAGALVHAVLVGFTHDREASGATAAPAGPEQEFFFAPAEIVRRGRGFAREYAEAWGGFAPVAGRALRIERVTDGDGLVRVYRELLEGRADPAAGFIASL